MKVFTVIFGRIGFPRALRVTVRAFDEADALALANLPSDALDPRAYEGRC